MGRGILAAIALVYNYAERKTYDKHRNTYIYDKQKIV